MTHDHTSPGGRLANRLAHVRRRLFVGRESEQALFCSALESVHSSFAVLHLYGPGGMGKSSLLREFGHIAAERGRTVAYIDGRAIALHPAGFLAHLAEALQV
ncbi:MAG TPA: ATP-binding protein, partial [Roseiflexaceae bacterium]|nr:ATP-binding protein [Roseiflexaceae bacterium]